MTKTGQRQTPTADVCAVLVRCLVKLPSLFQRLPAQPRRTQRSTSSWSWWSPPYQVSLGCLQRKYFYQRKRNIDHLGSFCRCLLRLSTVHNAFPFSHSKPSSCRGVWWGVDVCPDPCGVASPPSSQRSHPRGQCCGTLCRHACICQGTGDFMQARLHTRDGPSRGGLVLKDILCSFPHLCNLGFMRSSSAYICRVLVVEDIAGGVQCS